MSKVTSPHAENTMEEASGSMETFAALPLDCADEMFSRLAYSDV